MLKIDEKYDYSKYSAARKGFRREFLNEKGIWEDDKEYNDKCTLNKNIDLSKVYAEEAKETEASFFKKLCDFFYKKK